MLEYVKYIKRYATSKPRTYWCEFPFYTVICKFNQQFCLGYRPEDLVHLETIEQKAWKKHQAYLKRLDNFPIDKAEYYLRMKEIHGITSTRRLARVLGKDWSYIARTLRILNLHPSIKQFLQRNKNDPEIVKCFNLRKLIEIARQSEERIQLAYFRELIESIENSHKYTNNSID